MGSSNRNAEASQGALTYLQERGAHFVLLSTRRGTPERKRWQIIRPSTAAVLEHRGPLGLIPASIGTSALDIDQGDPTELLKRYPPLVCLPSKSPGHFHAYYQDDTPRGNAGWEACGCSGDVRSGRGYLRLCGAAPEQLSTVLRERKAKGVCFSDLPLFEAAVLEVPKQTAPEGTESTVQVPPYRPERLREVQKGPVGGVGWRGRNHALFDVLRWWAYEIWWREQGEQWHAVVREQALNLNQLFPEPLPEEEVVGMASKVSRGVAEGRGQVRDHSPMRQAARGRISGLVRRGILPSKIPGNVGSRRTGPLKGDVYLRDQEILAERAAGLTLQAIATKHNLSYKAVWNVVNRKE